MHDQSGPSVFTDEHTDLLLVTESDGSIRQVSVHAERLFGLPSAVIHGINAFTFFHPDDLPIVMSIVSEASTTGVESRPVEIRVRRNSDGWRAITLSAYCREDLGTPSFAFRLRGPDAPVRVPDQIARSALHDRVTDLPNRALFADRVEHALSRNARQGRPVAALAIGFNGYGASAGGNEPPASEDLVRAVAQRLRSCLRASDTVARLSHDEFGVLLEDVTEMSNARVVVDRIFRTMDVPFDDGATERLIGASIGAVISTSDLPRAENVLRAASIARAWAGVQGPGGFAEYDPTMAPPDNDDDTGQFDLREVMAAPTATTHAERNIADADDVRERLDRLERALATLTALATSRTD